MQNELDLNITPETNPRVAQERDSLREEYRARLAEKLKDPEFRKIEGFPIGTDEAILALSDPPYYTACPNPFIAEWLAANAKPYDAKTDSYHREPFAADVSEGKNDPIYNAHSYHTKVPHKAIMRYILHYTEPGDVVYDGFCGTGMTGVAAQMCGDKAQVESLGYIVDQEGAIWEPEAWQARTRQEEERGIKQEPRKTRNQEGEGEGRTHSEKDAEIITDLSSALPPISDSPSSPGFLDSWVPTLSGMGSSGVGLSGVAPFSKLGARKAILNDLSPAATFIAYNYNTPVDAVAFEREAKRILKEVEDECGWMYSTLHDASPTETERIAKAVSECQSADELRALYKDLQSSQSPLRDPNSKLQIGRINYTVWSEVFHCGVCADEVVFLKEALNEKTGEVLSEFQCPHCRSNVTKRSMKRAFESYFDTLNQITSQRVKRLPVFINYTLNKLKQEKKPDTADMAILNQVEEKKPADFFPALEVPYMHVTHVKDKMTNFGITHFSHFFLPRPQHTLATIWHIANETCERRLRNAMLYMVEQCIWTMTIMNRYRPTGFSQVNQYMSGIYYVPAQNSEPSPWYVLEGKANRLVKVFALLPKDAGVRVNLGSCSFVPVSEESVDYLFTDPPFGENLQYSELNWFNEAFYRVMPDNKPEAVVNKAQQKNTLRYLELMSTAFRENYRILKPGRWMTVEFHNSQNAIWNAIHEGIVHAGFIIADVRTLDKQGETYKQSLQGTVKADLVISCYKPSHDFEERFKQVQGKPEGVVEFLREHLAMLPVAPINKAGHLETVAERTRFLLFDRMVAYHLQHGARIPLSAADFYKLLEEQFVERDAMYFLNAQSARYDAIKARGVETEQLSIFVRDEKTAVQWIRARLSETPQTLGDLTPQLMQELREWENHEPRPELRDLLKEYFVEEGGIWHVPDPNNEKDLEAMRRNALLRLFREYTTAKPPLKVFRKEAVLEGFRHCWETQQYGVIVAVCEKIPEKILQEIQEFVMMYDVSKDLAPTMEPQTAFIWE